MMKALILSTAMALAIGGTALAQATQSAPPAAPDAATQPAPQAAPVNAPTSADPNAMTGAQPNGAAAGMDSQGGMNATTGAMAAPAAGADTAATVAPQTYPVCRTRAQDRCREPRSWGHS